MTLDPRHSTITQTQSHSLDRFCVRPYLKLEPELQVSKTCCKTCKTWTCKHGLVKHGLVKHGLVKHGLVKHGLVKHGLDLRANLLSMICFSICTCTYIEKQVKIHELFCCARLPLSPLVRLKCGSGCGTEWMRNGTDGVKMRNGTERIWG